jgi:hypothetical protein
MALRGFAERFARETGEKKDRDFARNCRARERI